MWLIEKSSNNCSKRLDCFLELNVVIYKTKIRLSKLRQKIKKFLDTKGEANTTEILEHVNSTMRHGTTPQQLGNVLSKDKDIMKIATTKRGGALSGRYEICVWQLRPGAIENQE